MRLTSTLSYFGAKRTLSPRIVEQIGPHRLYAEPFMGSLAVLMAKKPSSIERANDLYGIAINLARVLASEHYATLTDRCERTLLHEELQAEATEILDGSDLPDHLVAPSVGEVGPEHVDSAYWSLVLGWMGRNGTIGTKNYSHASSRRYTANGGSAEGRWMAVGESIPAWHDRLRRVFFSREDAIEMVHKLDDAPDTLIYCDPPYLVKGPSYVHDFTTDDHARLAEACNTKSRARVLVSYYEHPDLDTLYPAERWTRVPMPVSKSLVNAGQRDKSGVAVVAPEVLLVNGEDLGAGLFAAGGSA